MNTFRTFIAAAVTDSVRHAAERVIRSMSRLGLGVNWVQPQHMHVTLVFLGDITETDAPEVCRAAQSVARQFQPFSLEFQTLGAFPNTRRPRIVWMGTGGGTRMLADLQSRLAASLDDLGVEFDHRPFHAHLTLGRLRRVKQQTTPLAEAIQKYADQSFGESPVGELIVFSSELGHSGPVYTTMARAPLGS